MKNILFMILVASSLFLGLSGCTAALNVPMPETPFSRGINIANALEAPVEGDWGVVIQDWFFPEIASKGFDTIRVPVGWAYHLEEDGMTVDNAFFERVDHIVQQAISQNLNIILSFHSFDDFYEDPLNNEDQFKRIWEQITGQFLSRYPENLFFELLNEPHDNLTIEIWNRIQLEMIEDIRTIDPERWIILTGADWGNAGSLSSVILPENRYKLLATFHMYEPYYFTHQGVPWLGEDYSSTGVLWPGPPPDYIGPSQAAATYPEVVKWFDDYNTYPYPFNPAGPVPITEELHTAMSWSKVTGVPVFMGEFGTYELIDTQSRANWTNFVTNLADDMEICWIYWDFAGNFGIYDIHKQEWNDSLLNTLRSNNR